MQAEAATLKETNSKLSDDYHRLEGDNEKLRMELENIKDKMGETGRAAKFELEFHSVEENLKLITSFNHHLEEAQEQVCVPRDVHLSICPPAGAPVPKA